jgi:SAM-dependent methyltransferase
MSSMPGYYSYGFVPDVLQARIDAIKSVLPQASSLIDLGCNDGTISRTLIESGYARSSLGVDFENLRFEPTATLKFIAADLRQLDFELLPQADVILCLNLVHHLCLHGIDFARQFLRTLSTKADAVLLDMGSLDARIDPGLDARWLGALKAQWRCDEECWADLFSPFPWRRAVLTYPFQHGRRVLWKLVSAREPAYEFDVLQQPSAAPAIKILKRRGCEELFWAKSYEDGHGANDRQTLWNFLRTAPFDTMLPLLTHAEHGDIYAYDPELAVTEGLSFSESLHAFTPEEFLRVRQFSDQKVPALNHKPLGLACDFCVHKTARGLTFSHFEPRRTY